MKLSIMNNNSFHCVSVKYLYLNVTLILCHIQGIVVASNSGLLVGGLTSGIVYTFS